MKGIKSSFIIFILISQSIISNAKYIEKFKDYFGDYPYLYNLENYFKKFDELNDGSIYSMLKNMDPQTLKSIAEDFGKILSYGKTAIDYIKNDVKSLSKGIQALVGNSEKALSITLNFLGQHSLQILGTAAIVLPTFLFLKNKKDNLNQMNDRIVYEIKKLINQKKYKDFIANKIGDELENILNRGIDELNLKKFIEDYLNTNNKLEKLNKKFSGKIDSLNFIVIGDTGVGKSSLINKILDLKSEVDGAFVNEDLAEPTTLEFKKYKNDNKTGIQLIDSRGIESNQNYNTKYFMGNFTNYHYNNTIINESNSNFIYCILYIGEANTFSEDDLIIELKNKYNKIPLKILYTKYKKDNEIKRLNQKIKNTTNISAIFLNTNSDKNYEKNLNKFLNGLFNELSEEKLKEIYQYYYNSNIYDIFKKIIIENNNLEAVLTSNSKIEPVKFILSKLELDLKILLNQNINIELTQPIQDIYRYIIRNLNEDIKNLNYQDYSLKEYDDKNVYDKFKEYFISNPLPDEIVSLGISQIINDLIIDKFLEAIKRELSKDPIKVGNYPDFSIIKNLMEKNFLKNHESTSISLGCFLIIIIIMAILFYFKSCNNKKEKEKEKNMDNLIHLEDQDI